MRASAIRRLRAKDTAEPEVGVETLAEKSAEWAPPEVIEKRLLGSRVRWPDFGPMLALAAWRWGFFGAHASGSDQRKLVASNTGPSTHTRL